MGSERAIIRPKTEKLCEERIDDKRLQWWVREQELIGYQELRPK